MLAPSKFHKAYVFVEALANADAASELPPMTAAVRSAVVGSTFMLETGQTGERIALPAWAGASSFAGCVRGDARSPFAHKLVVASASRVKMRRILRHSRDRSPTFAAKPSQRSAPHAQEQVVRTLRMGPLHQDQAPLLR